MSLYSAAFVVVLGLTILAGIVRMTIGRRIHERQPDFELSFLAHWAIRVVFNAIVPLVLIANLNASAPDRAGIFEVPLAYVVVALLVATLVLTLQNLLDRMAPSAASAVRLFLGHERDTSEDYLRRPEVEAPLEGELAAAAAELDGVNARFAHGAEFLKESTRPTFAANCAALSAGIARMEAAIDATAAPVPLEAFARLTDARERLRTLQEQALRNRVGA
jgi:hypothetical protein